MKKLLTLIVPLALLIAFASVSVASEDAELNRDLNRSLSDDGSRSEAAARDEVAAVDDDTAGLTEMNTDIREARTIAVKRGRQPRRGQTSSELAELQAYWGRHDDDDEDEGADEDEDGDQTPMYP